MDDARRRWDERYAAGGYRYGTAPNDFLAAQAHRIPPGRVLCLADGEGRNGVFLAGLGYEVASVDVSPVGLRKARRLAAERGVALRTVAADLEDVRVERGGWSAVVSIFAHLPPELRVRVHRRVVQGLAPGGVLVLEAFPPAGPGGDPRFVDEATLRGELAGLRFEVARQTRRALNEGALHTGVRDVVQLLAFKPGAVD